jgi:XTP/dITP diphosphohydrolase
VKELLIATANKGKFREIELLLQGVVDRLYTVTDFPELPEVVEDGKTFEENAIKKAQSASKFSGKPVIADDSGLMVDILNGDPGVRSARYAGEGSQDDENNAKLLRNLADVPLHLRTATFHAVIALCFPDGSCRTFTGYMRGIVLDAPMGNGGFGYDPFFLVPDLGQTLAEIPIDIKNSISHRGKALFKLKEHLLSL